MSYYTDRLMEVHRGDRPKTNQFFLPFNKLRLRSMQVRARFKRETKSVSSIIFLNTQITPKPHRRTCHRIVINYIKVTH